MNTSMHYKALVACVQSCTQLTRKGLSGNPQPTGKNSVQILRESVRSGKLCPHPPHNYVIQPAARSAPHNLLHPGPQPAPPRAAQPAPHLSGLQPAQYHNKWTSMHSHTARATFKCNLATLLKYYLTARQHHYAQLKMYIS